MPADATFDTNPQVPHNTIVMRDQSSHFGSFPDRGVSFTRRSDPVSVESGSIRRAYLWRDSRCNGYRGPAPLFCGSFFRSAVRILLRLIGALYHRAVGRSDRTGTGETYEDYCRRSHSSARGRPLDRAVRWIL